MLSKLKGIDIAFYIFLLTAFVKLITFRILPNKIIKVSLQIILLLSVLCFLIVWRINEHHGGVDNLAIALLAFIGFCYLIENLKLTIISWLILMFMLPYMLGWTNARIQNEFYIINNKTDYLVIDFYDNKAIAAKFDAKQKIIYPDLKLISVDSIEENKDQIKLIRVENLKVDQISTIK